jgi:DNA-binding NtrC family response regulator
MEAIRVLIVDDEEELASTLAERLVLRGFQVESATSGTEALKLARQSDFNVVIADVKMPGIDGLDLMAEIKRDDPELQVILITGHGSVAEAERGKRAGAFEYVMKPIDIDALVEKIRNAARKEGGVS